jgi:Cu/Ag efflux protein CusF
MSDSYGRIKVDEIVHSSNGVVDLSNLLRSGDLNPVLYATLGDLPAASGVHGAIAHVHSEGAMFFAHGGSWTKIQNFPGNYNDLTNKPSIPTIDADTVIDANYVATDENFTTADHTKLDGIETGAQVNAANTVIDANYVATDENFTTADHTKLDGIEAGAEVNTVTSVNGSTGAVTVTTFSGNYNDLTNKPTIPSAGASLGLVIALS